MFFLKDTCFVSVYGPITMFTYYDLYINEKTTHELKACHYEKDGTITSYSR